MSTLPEKHQIISDMVMMAKSDQRLDDREYDFIVAVATRLGVSEQEVQRLIDLPKPTEKVYKTELARITQFHRLVLVMNVDGHIDQDEVVLLRNYALRQGIRSEAVNQILNDLSVREGDTIPADRLVSIFKRFYN